MVFRGFCTTDKMHDWGSGSDGSYKWLWCKPSLLVTACSFVQGYRVSKICVVLQYFSENANFVRHDDWHLCCKLVAFMWNHVLSQFTIICRELPSYHISYGRKAITCHIKHYASDQIQNLYLSDDVWWNVTNQTLLINRFPNTSTIDRMFAFCGL